MQLYKKTLLASLISLSVVACGGDNNESPTLTPTPAPEVFPQDAAVITIAPDYSASAVAYIDSSEQQITTDYYTKDKSDYTLTTFGLDVYHIGRFTIDTIAKYNYSDVDTQLWQFDVVEAGVEASSNPYTLVFASEDKAYLLNYGWDKAWVVNPKAESFEDFKIGELDLSAYILPSTDPALTPTTPHTSSAVVNNGKLYIAMQRFDVNVSAGPAYVAVFDTATDQEIETNANADDGLKGIPLTGVNPLGDSLKALGDSVYVTTRAGYSSSNQAESTIEVINTTDYSVNVVATAADIEDNDGDFFHESIIIDESSAFVLTSATSFDPYAVVSSVYQLNLATGELTLSPTLVESEQSVSDIALDNQGFIWLSVSNPQNPGVDVFNSDDLTQYGDRYPTVLNPGTIRFITE